jgi:hypothetical protein
MTPKKGTKNALLCRSAAAAKATVARSRSRNQKKERRRREVPPAGGRPFVRLLNESASYNKLILLAARPDLEGAKEERE